MAKKILITGSDGFIDSHLTEALLRAGYDVNAFVLYNSFHSWWWLYQCAEDVKGKFEVFAGVIRDPHAVHTAMTGCDAVLHLASYQECPRGPLPVAESLERRIVNLPSSTGLA